MGGASVSIRSAAARQQTPALELTPAQAITAILTAEDRRLPLPDGLQAPAVDTLRGLQADDVRLLMQLARSRNSLVRERAIRAMGRYERRELTPELQLIMASQDMSATTISAVAQSLRGPAMPLDMSADQMARFFRPEFLGGMDARRELWYAALPALSRAIGRLPYTTAAQVQAADEFLVRTIVDIEADPLRQLVLADVARAAESRARVHTKIAPLSDELITWLRRLVIGTRRSYHPTIRAQAMQALVSARAVDTEALRAAASDQDSPDLRRLAALSIAGVAGTLAPAERADTLITLLSDRDLQVRIEAVRAWARRETTANGCMRIIWAAKDPAVPVALMALDLLGDACPTDINVTDLLTVEAKTPHPTEWHRNSHALVSLARRAPDRVALSMPSHVTAVAWQARMYAARAAAITNDVVALERLSMDVEDNVREAALPALRRLKKAESDVQFVAALTRRDYQLLRTASRELKGATSTPELAGALGDALRRVTLEKKDTSRDVRLELLDRLRELGSEDQSGAVALLVQDFDLEVAQAGAQTLQQWTGRAQELNPVPLVRPLSSAGDGAVKVRVQLRHSKDLIISLRPDVAPMTCARFLRLATSGYYSGLTFHRVVPNFVIQGGSPGANEYAGDSLYMRDEIGMLKHTRGTVGISTRGRDTGDAQFFVNLVDNPRLDFDYTVFGEVTEGNIEEILEGEVIVSITLVKPDDEKQQGAGRPSGVAIECSGSATRCSHSGPSSEYRTADSE